MSITVDSLWRRIQHTRLRDALRGRFDGRLDWRQAIAAVDLPAPIAETITRLVRRTRLWRSEKIDIAQELVTHFQDGLERGQSAEQLLAQFGDVERAAKLTRSAKRRNRPLLWHGLHWACCLMGGILCVYVVAALFMLTGKPSITTDYLAILNKRAASLPEDQRAWPLYREALFELGYREGELAEEISEKLFARPGDENWSDLSAFLEAHPQALAKLRRASSMKEMGHELGFGNAPADEAIFGMNDSQPIDSEQGPHPALIQIRLAHVQSLRSVTGFLAADTYRTTIFQEGDAVAANLSALLNVTRQAGQEPFLVSGMVSLGMEGMGLQAIEDLLTTEPDLLSEEQLQKLAHQIAAGADPPVERWIEGERMWFYDFVQRVYSDDGQGDGRITRTGIKHCRRLMAGISSNDMVSFMDNEAFATAALPAINLLVASRRDLVAEYDRLMDFGLREMATPLWESEGVSMEDHFQQLFDDTQWKLRYLPAWAIMPSAGAFRITLEIKRGEREGVLVGIALELYRREHGEWPRSLKRLSPRYLAELPVDRLTGEPLRYRVVDDRPLVYSVGCDGDDDQGRATVDKSGNSNVPWSFHSHLPVDGDWVVWSTVKTH